MTPSISIIIPAFNEEDRIIKSIQKIKDYFDEKGYNYEIILSDDGSTDNTVSMCIKTFPDLRIIKSQKNSGKGAAVKKGMLAGKNDILLFTDADLSTPIYEIEKIIYSLSQGFDVAIGSRALDYQMIKEHQPFYREFMGKIFNKIVQLFVFEGISDTQCGFKAYKKSVAHDIFKRSKINGYSFDVESLYLAKILNYNIDEIPVEWFNDERSKVNPLTDSLKMLLEIFKIRKLHHDIKK